MAKKVFSNLVQESVTIPVNKHAESVQPPVRKTTKFKIKLDDSNATKRTFYIREDLLNEFDLTSATSKIDKGALINLMIKEWLAANKGRTEFEQF